MYAYEYDYESDMKTVFRSDIFVILGTILSYTRILLINKTTRMVISMHMSMTRDTRIPTNKFSQI